jgi:hypothetical protein
MSPGHFINDNKQGWLNLSARFARYAIKPTWTHLTALSRVAMTNRSAAPTFDPSFHPDNSDHSAIRPPKHSVSQERAN